MISPNVQFVNVSSRDGTFELPIPDGFHFFWRHGGAMDLTFSPCLRRTTQSIPLSLRRISWPVSVMATTFGAISTLLQYLLPKKFLIEPDRYLDAHMPRRITLVLEDSTSAKLVQKSLRRYGTPRAFSKVIDLR